MGFGRAGLTAQKTTVITLMTLAMNPLQSYGQNLS